MRNAARAVAALLLAAARGGSAETLLEALTDNLIVNGGPDVDSMEGWDDVVNGGDGWNVILEGQEEDGGEQVNGCDGGADSTCENVFQTSYVPCTRRQTVALEVPGKVDAALLDSGTVAIHVSEEVKEFYDVDKFFIRAALCKDKKCKHKVARWAPCKAESKVKEESSYSWCETAGGTKDAWKVHNHTFGGAEVPGARYLLWEDGGVDSEYWKGWFGPWFRRAQVMIHKSDHTFAPTVSPAPTPVSEEPSKAPTPAPSHEAATFDDLGYGGGDYGDDASSESDHPEDTDSSSEDTDAAPAAKPSKPHHPRTPAPSPGADPFIKPEIVKEAAPSSPTVMVKYAVFAVLAVLGGFGIGYLVRKKRDGPTHEYGIAGTQLDEDEEGVEMAGFA